jgi:hypothetical protein
MYAVKMFEVEVMPVFVEETGKYKEEYSRRVGFGMSNSPKKAYEVAHKMYAETSNGGTPIIGGEILLKGNKVLKEYDWNENWFNDMYTSYKEDKELEELIRLEEESK